MKGYPGQEPVLVIQPRCRLENHDKWLKEATCLDSFQCWDNKSQMHNCNHITFVQHSDALLFLNPIWGILELLIQKVSLYLFSLFAETSCPGCLWRSSSAWKSCAVSEEDIADSSSWDITAPLIRNTSNKMDQSTIKPWFVDEWLGWKEAKKRLNSFVTAFDGLNTLFVGCN